jgi:hypothetical protein
MSSGFYDARVNSRPAAAGRMLVISSGVPHLGAPFPCGRNPVRCMAGFLFCSDPQRKTQRSELANEGRLNGEWPARSDRSTSFAASK